MKSSFQIFYANAYQFNVFLQLTELFERISDFLAINFNHSLVYVYHYLIVQDRQLHLVEIFKGDICLALKIIKAI